MVTLYHSDSIKIILRPGSYIDLWQIKRVQKNIYILKRKSFATLNKMIVPYFGPKQSLSDSAVDKSLYSPRIQHKNQNDVAYGCRAASIILRQPLILKSHGYNTSHVMRKIFF